MRKGFSIFLVVTLFSMFFFPGIVSKVEAGVFKTITDQEFFDLLTEGGFSPEWLGDKKDLIMINFLFEKKKHQVVFFVVGNSALEADTIIDIPGIKLSKINDWNEKKRYTRAFLDEKGRPSLSLDLDLTGGVTKERLLHYVDIAKVQTVRFSEFLSSQSSE